MTTHKLIAYLKLMRFDRPIGIYLLLWPTLWALWIAAQGMPNLKLLIIFIVGVVCMRAAGCVINDIADKDFDPHVARTKNRPLACQQLSIREAWGAFILLLCIACILVLMLNRSTLYLAIIGVIITSIYPFCKRFTYLPQFVLGAAFSWGIPMAFVAQTGQLPGIAWLLFAATWMWIVAYDTMYAMADREDDLQIGVKSTAIFFGQYDKIIVASLQMMALVLLVMAGIIAKFGVMFFASLVIAAMLMGYQQYLIRQRQPMHCFKAFLNNAIVGGIIFLGVVASLPFSLHVFI